jgi:2-phosphoglycerate kinase
MHDSGRMTMMLYLIGGAPGSGKSFLAKQISARQSLDVIELDGYMPNFNASIPKDEFSVKLPVWQAKFDKRAPSYEDYSTEARTYWPTIEQIIDEGLASGSNVAIEGAQLSPMLIREWLDKLNANQQGQVVVVFLSEPNIKHNQDFVNAAEHSGFTPLSRQEASSRY